MFCMASGCAKDRIAVEKNLMAQKSVAEQVEVALRYRVGCPDIIEITTPRMETSGRFEIQPDGRIDLGDYGNLRIEGRTPQEVAKIVAEETGANPAEVEVRVAEFRSQHLLLFGEIIGSQRSISYRGPETVLDALQRVGGITPGAEPRDVYVLRPHLGDHQRPEVFHVDLHSIVLKHDHKTNIRLLPFDQIFVGETRKAQIEKAIPPFVRSAYQAIWEKPAGKEKDSTER